jgi:mannose-1-phosphate guanylyltransferase
MPAMNDILGVILGGGRGSRLFPLTNCREISPDRYSDQQLHQFRDLPHQCTDTIQLTFASPTHFTNLHL